MCLHNAAFSLNWDEAEQCFTGQGYKVVPKEYLNKIGIGSWKQATFGKFNPERNVRHREITDKNQYYHPGFHIFLNQKDAEHYDKDKNSVTIHVKFRNVIAFGRNTINIHDYDQKEIFKNCIVSDEMKIISTLPRLYPIKPMELSI